MGNECVMDGGEHEFNKGGAVCEFRAGGNRGIVGRLRAMHGVLYGEIGKHGMGCCQQERLPEAPQSTIAIGKGVNEFEFIVKHAAANQPVRIRA